MMIQQSSCGATLFKHSVKHFRSENVVHVSFNAPDFRIKRGINKLRESLIALNRYKSLGAPVQMERTLYNEQKYAENFN